MKKIFTSKCRTGLLRFSVLALFVLAGVYRAQAQIPASAYIYAAATGTYTDITGTTGLVTLPNSFLTDDATVGSIPIGFTFNYCGTNYTQLAACTNGWVSFNATTTNTQWTNSLANLSTAPNIKPALMVLWDDLGASSGTGGSASYVTTGTAPNRVFTFQWKNWQWTVGSGVNMSFQLKLYETTNVIEYVYKQETGAGAPSSATIGIADGGAPNPGYLTLNNSSSTATASSTTFTTSINTKPATNQIFRFTPPPPCTSVATWPAATAATATPNPVCISSGTVSLDITTAMPLVTGLTYQWEWSLNGTTGWTTIGPALTSAPYTATGITTSRYFRCKVYCNASTTPVWTSNNTPQVVVSDPGSPTVTNGARCGPGIVTLSATTSAPNGSIRWYPSLTATIPLATTNNYTTNYLTQTTTYYAVAVTNATLQTYNVGLPNFIQNNPFITTSAGWGLNFTVLNTCNIDSVGVYPIGTGTISMAIYNATTQALVYTSPVSPTITGTGVEKRMISVGALNLPPGNYVMGVASFTGLTNLRNEGFNASAYPFTCPALNITSGAQGFGSTTPNVYYFSYDWRVSAIGGCEGPRVAVTATVNSSPAVTKTAPPVVCNNSVATITLTPPTPAYPNYTWTPATNLFTDAGCTIPYVAGNSATTVYMKTTSVGTQTYAMMAGNPQATTGCTFADTVKVWVQPGNVQIKGQPDTICVSGTSTLSLDTISGYYAGSIQWQTSTDGVFYTDINGATNPTYVTPTLNFGQNTYYRANIKAGTATCQSPVKYIVVANPTLINAPDSFNCGPGTVTLTAVTGGNGTAVWYNGPTGGLPIASGNIFVTPFLGSTTSYYVAAGGGGMAGTQAIGAGASSGSGSYSPFVGGWGGRKHQYLIKASELLAAGIPAGANINSLAFEVTGGAGTTFPGFAISMGATTNNNLTAGFSNTLSTVRNGANVTIANGINTLTFDTPFPWNGTSNIIIQTCWSNGTNTSAAGTVKYDAITGANNAVTRYTQNDNQTPAAMCAATGGTTLTQRPKMILGYDNRCESPRQEVIAYIHPVPVVDLGPDINKCVDEGAVEVLDAGYQPNTPQYLWDNGSTSQVRAVSQSGSYWAKVTNQYTCTDEDTIMVTLRDNPVVHLGNDTTVCNGVTLALNAGNQGIDYFWNTGATTQIINVNSPGTYNVFVTNNQGCTKADTIVVNMAGELPSIQGIQVSNNGQYTFHFTAVNPQNVIGYEWDFGDSSPLSYQVSPSHTYANNGNYIVTLRLSSTCGFYVDSSSAHIVGIHQLNVSNDELTVFPNPSRGTATILNKGDLKMEKIQIYNVVGQVIYEAKADSKDKHTLDLGGIASGVYTIEVFTDKGTVPRKLEVIR